MTRVPTASESSLRTVTLAVAGMTCGACANHVRQALAGVAGVRAADVDRPRAQAIVLYDPADVAPHDLMRAIEDAGYLATLPPVPGATWP